MNKYDSLLAEGRFKRQGYVTTESMDEADVVLFNTCSVREHAEERTYSWLGELKRAKTRIPRLVIGVMGCMAQRVGDEIFARAGHVDIVAGTRQFANLPRLVEEVRASRALGLHDRATRILALQMDDAGRGRSRRRALRRRIARVPDGDARAAISTARTASCPRCAAA
jgi:tRNA A37 methylthiotransferase MiaB